jgi:hypothetical protein
MWDTLDAPDIPDIDLDSFVRVMRDVWGSSLVQGSRDMQLALKILVRRFAMAYPKCAKHLDFNERG